MFFFLMEIGTFWTVGLMVTKYVNFEDWIIKMKDEKYQLNNLKKKMLFVF